MQMGLKYVYEGNIWSDGGNTICPGCKQVVIKRSWHSVTANKLKDGCCPKCGTRDRRRILAIRCLDAQGVDGSQATASSRTAWMIHSRQSHE